MRAMLRRRLAKGVGLGESVRTRLGRWETPAAELYRSVFIDLDDLARTTGRLAPSVTRILEIGCGDGSVADRMNNLYPDAEYLGIDVARSAGRRYTGDPHRARFRSMTSSELVDERPEPFDLVLVVDVLHHVPNQAARVQLLRDAAALVAPGGRLLIKDWERHAGLTHALTFAADRYISGDRTVSFMSTPELRGLLSLALPEMSIDEVTWVKPHRANALYALTSSA